MENTLYNQLTIYKTNTKISKLENGSASGVANTKENTKKKSFHSLKGRRERKIKNVFKFIANKCVKA